VKIFDPSTGTWIDDGVNPNTPSPNIGALAPTPKNVLISDPKFSPKLLIRGKKFDSWYFRYLSGASSGYIQYSPLTQNIGYNLYPILSTENNKFGFKIKKADGFFQRVQRDPSYHIQGYMGRIGFAISNQYIVSGNHGQLIYGINLSAVEIISIISEQNIFFNENEKIYNVKTSVEKDLEIPANYSLFLYDGNFIDGGLNTSSVDFDFNVLLDIYSE
jgi:hypothetical protein